MDFGDKIFDGTFPKANSYFMLLFLIPSIGFSYFLYDFIKNGALDSTTIVLILLLVFMSLLISYSGVRNIVKPKVFFTVTTKGILIPTRPVFFKNSSKYVMIAWRDILLLQLKKITSARGSEHYLIFLSVYRETAKAIDCSSGFAIPITDAMCKFHADCEQYSPSELLAKLQELHEKYT